MTREEYLTLEEAVKNVSLREKWYIVLPAPEKLKNFDSLGCRTIMFVVTDVPITNKDYMKSFDMIEDLHLTYHALIQNPYIQKNINILDHSMSSSLNRKARFYKRVCVASVSARRRALICPARARAGFPTRSGSVGRARQMKTRSGNRAMK